MDDHSRRLRRNALSGIVTMGASVVVVFGAHGVYLRLLGYQTYGVWLLLSTVSSFAQLGNIGITPAVTKLVAEAIGSGDRRKAEAFQTTASAIMIVTGAVALLVTIALRPWLGGWLGLAGADGAVFARLLVPIGALSGYVLLVNSTAGALAGAGRMDLPNYARLAGRIVAFGISAALLLRNRELDGLFIGQAAGNVVLHVCTIVALRREAGFGLFRPSNVTVAAARRLIGVGSPIFGGSILNMLLSPLNKFLIARGAGAAAVPIYEIAFSASMQLRAVIDSAAGAMMPEVSRLSVAGAAGAARIAQLVRTATTRSLAAGVLLHGTAFSAAGLALHLWLGNVPPSQVVALRVMLVASWLSIVGVPSYQALLGTGHVRNCFCANAIQSTVNGVIAGLVLILAPHSVALYVVAAGSGLVTAHVYLWLVARRVLVLQPLRG